MKTVRTFMNLAQAGFASSLLDAAGIPALLADEQSFLWSYGMATGGIRLQVEDADLENALRVLEQGMDSVAARPETEVAHGVGTEIPANDEGKIPVAVFAAPALMLGLLAFAIWNTHEPRRAGSVEEREQTYDFDYNHDGRADHFFTYRGQQVVQVNADRNADGKVDEWEAFDPEGRIERIELDDNFDGRPDQWFNYRHGQPDTSREDNDFNGLADYFSTYENGVLVRSDVKPNESGVVVRRFIYTANVLREEWVDEDKDGAFDYKLLHDPFGTPSDKIALEQKK